MTDAEKLAQVKSLMNITGTDLDAQLAVFLSFAKNEIRLFITASRRYRCSGATKRCR